jgi:alpha-glucosidase (family GH31 glycosyl hydrolase)
VGDRENEESTIPLLADLHTRAYAYDESTGAVWHYVRASSYIYTPYLTYLNSQTERESPLPSSEVEGSPGRCKHQFRNEFIYGLGESVGSIVKNDRRFTMEARDAMGYDMDFGGSLFSSFLQSFSPSLPPSSPPLFSRLFVVTHEGRHSNESVIDPRLGDPMYKAGFHK